MANSGPIEFHVDDLERVTQFYWAVFGWDVLDAGEAGDKQLLSLTNFKLPDDNRFVLEPFESESEGIIPKGVLFAVKVTSIPETLSRIALWEGKIILTDLVLPGKGLMAYCKDTEGNLFGIIQTGRSDGS
jgi:predicted enzyme related to lactoylglutathione lyase